MPTHGSGTLPAANVTNVAVTCAVPKEWSWESGSDVPFVGVYGTQGTAAAGNVPGARQESVSWTDKAGNLWLFGGYGYSASNSYLNDLWRYSTSTGLWTWVGGSTGSNAIGVYGTLGVAAPGNVPGARTGAVSWTDRSGNFWLFGGTDSAGAFNDLWRYSPTTVCGPGSAVRM